MPPHPSTTLRLLRNLHTTRPSHGVISSLRGAYDTAVSSNESRTDQNVFQTQLKYLSAPQRLTPHVFLSMLREIKSAVGLSGFREHLPWMASNPALGEFKDQEKILGALTEEESRDVRKVKIAAKKRIARDTGLALGSVEALIDQVQLTGWMQIVVRRRLEAGESVLSSKQLQSIMRKSGNGGVGGGTQRFPNPGVKQNGRGRS